MRLEHQGDAAAREGVVQENQCPPGLSRNGRDRVHAAPGA
jgi:hypothetical protein